LNKRILITGGSGTLGGNLAKILSDFYDVYATYYENSFKMSKVKTFKLNIINKKEVIEKIEIINPKIIIHCAAMTYITACERMPELAFEVNVEGTQNICNAAKLISAKVIYISTDHVFDGRSGYYSEYDVPNPINIYGKTKYLGEALIRESNLDYNIIRTCFYGFDIVNMSKYNFIMNLIDRLRRKKKVRAYKDIYFSPIFINNLVEAIMELCFRRINGIFHIAADERISHYDFVNLVADVFQLDHKLIKEDEFKNHRWSKLRGLDLSLNIDKAKKILKTRLLRIKSNLEFMKKLYDSNYYLEHSPIYYFLK